MNTIYFLSDPRRPKAMRYIGQTSFELPIRLKRHIRQAKSDGDCLPRNKWIRSLLRRRLQPLIFFLESARTKQAADLIEEKWIKANWGKLLNVAPRACGVLRHTAETKRKMAAAKLGRKLSSSHRARIGEASKKMWADPATRTRICKALMGRQFTAATRRKMSRSAKQRVISERQRQRISKSLKSWYATHPQSDETKLKRQKSVCKAWSDERLRRTQSQRIASRSKNVAYLKRLSRAIRLSWARRKAGASSRP